MRDVSVDFDLSTQGSGETDLERALKIASRLTSSNYGSVPSDTLIFTVWTLARSVLEARQLAQQVYCTCNTARHDSEVLTQVMESLQVKCPVQGEDASRSQLCPIHTPAEVVARPT
jgi:hypothetical protein